MTDASPSGDEADGNINDAARDAADAFVEGAVVVDSGDAGSDGALGDADASDGTIGDAEADASDTDAGDGALGDADASDGTIDDADAVASNADAGAADADAGGADADAGGADADASGADADAWDDSGDGSDSPTADALQAIGSDCLSCANAYCIGVLGDTCDTFSGSQLQECLSLLSCALKSSCGVTDNDPSCLCGFVDPSACGDGSEAPLGACRSSYFDDFEAGAPVILQDFEDPQHPTGAANQFVGCLQDPNVGCPSCFGP